MKIATIKEYEHNESRVAITPESAKKLAKAGFEVCLQKDAGAAAFFANEEYEKFAKVSSVALEILADSDIIAKVQPPAINGELYECEFAKPGSVIIGFMQPHQNKKMIEFYAKKKISLLAMDLVPRTTKAQSFDALSSQAGLMGYRAVTEAANLFSRSFSMLMTSAGTISPAKVLVVGAGVAGLAAIAAAKRLGAVVTAYDVRAASKEQVESLGAKFIHPDESLDFSTSSGYAKEVTNDFAQKQDQMFHEKIDKFDIVILTAMIPGKKAPVIITKSMVEKMPKGSVIVDLAASTGGNCELTERDKIIDFHGISIIGYSNFAGRIPHDASRLYANNIANLVQYLYKDRTSLDLDDDIVKSMLLTHDGEILFKS
ncbi:MAG: Re/Si-specific NAD(P)(+) transhydrogenase subunit alpha [Rickettsiaceae bacterium]|nr:Re/Si-specific NAD(P)(+) transhydrogenase subunit alpha [Rickettsiaceae bacterium]